MDRHPTLDVRLLGGFEVRVGDRLVPATIWGQRRAAAIVKLLALEPGHRLHREQLLDLLWPELDPDSAANNLRVALHHARRGLEQAGAPARRFLAREGDALVLGPRGAVRVDVESFAQAVARAWQSDEPEAAEAAANLYYGELLPDDPYEDWAAARREAIRASDVTLLTRLSGLYEERGDLPRAIAARERALAVDALDEATNGAIIRLFAVMGRREAALAHYARFAAQLQRELGVAPERETRELAAAIREGRIPAVPPSPKPPPSTPTLAVAAPLPASVDALVGRERELAELARLLTGSRLVTLTGPGGIGKTRLALEAARAERTRYPDGAAFVDLSALRDPELVLPTAARALGVDLSAGQPVTPALAAAIGERRLLVVLDNLEQVVSSGADVAALLAACPRLSVLATSRVRLRVRGEQEYPVSPLPLPASTRHEEAGLLPTLAASPAVALFVRRAQAARPDFGLTAENAEAVAAICRRLDGLPLAIELASARVRVLTPEDLLRRLERPLDALGTATADLPERQRTLRATIAWSYDLLATHEQPLFRRVGLFAGGWTLEGAAAVAAVGRDAAIDPVDAVAGLIDQSLVGVRPGSRQAETRYTMLETIREFAVERLAASGERAEVERAFEAYLVDLAARAETGLDGPDQLHWLERLEEDHDNFRVALGRMVERGDGEAALMLAPRLWAFWRIRGYPVEGHGWLERALAAAPAADAASRAAAHYALGKLSMDLGAYEAADRHFRASAGVWQELGDRESLVNANNSLVTVMVNVGETAPALALGEETLALARELGYTRGIAASLLNLGMLAREDGRFAEAIAMLEESLVLVRQMGDLYWVALTLLNLASAYQLAGNHDAAQPLLEESAERYARLGDRFHLGVVALSRGHLAREANRPAEARRHYADALGAFESVNSIEGVVEAIEWVAVTLVASDALAALRLFAATAAARQAHHLPTLESDAVVIESSLAEARQAAGHRAAEALTAGAGKSLAEARAIAMAASGEPAG